MRTGRCSNEPRNCQLAAAGTDLPYAGPGSVCPECGSPLAPVAAGEPAATQAWHPPTESDLRGRSGPGPLTLTAIALVLLVVGAGGWLLLRGGGDGPSDQPFAQMAQGAPGDVRPVSPPELRRLSVGAEVREAPDSGSEMMVSLPAGALVDVTGTVAAGGTQWARIGLPGSTARQGFVRADALAPMADGDALALQGMNGVAGALVPAAEGPPVARPPQTYYVTANRANVRAAPNAASARVAEAVKGAPLTVTAQQIVGTETWYMVQIPTGTGWISSTLVSMQPPAGTPLPVLAPDAPSAAQRPEVEGHDESAQEAADAAFEAAFRPGARIRVASANSNVRDNAGTDGTRVLETLPQGTRLRVEQVRVIQVTPWYLVTTPSGGRGWVSGKTVSGGE